VDREIFRPDLERIDQKVREERGGLQANMSGIDVQTPDLAAAVRAVASFVSAPVQRNTREENAVIKEGAVPLEWGKTPNKLAHKDVDARWTKKGGQSYYGYKNHVNMDREMKLVAAQTCTDASVHDSQMLEAVLRGPEEGREQGMNRSGFSPQSVATRAKPLLIRPAASPHPKKIYRSALMSFQQADAPVRTGEPSG